MFICSGWDTSALRQSSLFVGFWLRSVRSRSVWIPTAFVPWWENTPTDDGRGGDARDRSRMFAEVDHPALYGAKETLDYTEAINRPSIWAGRSELKRVAAEVSRPRQTGVVS